MIVRLPQSDSFSSLSDLMKRLQPRQSTAAAQSRGSKAAASELSQSMMDLSIHQKDTNNVPVPRFKPTVSVFIHLSVSKAIFFFKKNVMQMSKSLTN